MDFVKLFTTVAPDFEVLFLAAKDLFTQANPYLNPNIFTGVGYPPNTLLYYLPLTNFSYMIAQNIFTFISIVCLVVSVYLSIKIIRKKVEIRYILLFLFLSFISFPFRFTLGMGQNNLVALVLVLAAVYFSKSKKYLLSGILLGLSISLKTIFVYFLIYFLFKRNFKLVIYSLLTIFISVLAIYGIYGSFDLYRFYFINVLPPLFNYEGREIYYNQGLSALASHLFSDANYRKLVTTILGFVVVITNIVYLMKKNSDNNKFAFTTICLLLLDSLAWQHHFVWLIFPFINIYFNWLKNIKLLIFLLLPYTLISLNLPNVPYLSINVFIGNLMLFFIYLKIQK